MPARIRFILITLMALSLACNMPSFVGSDPQPSPVALSATTPQIIAVAPPGSTPTPTPFMPLPPTGTYIPTDMPTPVPTNTPQPTVTNTPEGLKMSGFVPKAFSDYAGPTLWPDVDIPSPVGILPQPEGQVNILLLGSDQRQNDAGFRTDTILLLTLNPNLGTANITSFPRDLYVYIPGWTVQRINTAFPHGGFETMALTMEYNFGVRPDYYALINFWSFSDVVDSLGGVDVRVASTLTDQREGHGQFTVPAGTYHMDGETALWYVRSRHSSSDFERGQRQQEVIQAIFLRVLSLDGVTRAPQLYDAYKRNVQTNLTINDITPLLPLAAELGNTSDINHFFIGRGQVYDFRTSQGAAVLIPVRDAVLQVMYQALNIPQD